MKLKQAEHNLEKDYHVSWYIIVYKFGFGLIELLFGLGIVLFGRQAVQLYKTFAAQELSEDPHDILVHISSGFIPYILSNDTFLVIYLILLGAVKIAGSIGLIYKQIWGADLLVGLTIVMFPFQVINLVMHPNIFDVVYITVGIFIALYLIEFKPKAWISRMMEHWMHVQRVRRTK